MNNYLNKNSCLKPLIILIMFLQKKMFKLLKIFCSMNHVFRYVTPNTRRSAKIQQRMKLQKNIEEKAVEAANFNPSAGFHVDPTFSVFKSVPKDAALDSD